MAPISSYLYLGVGGQAQAIDRFTGAGSRRWMRLSGGAKG
jgi:hypothetical protein